MVTVQRRQPAAVYALLALVVAACSSPAAQPRIDPLPSWNNGEAKQAILDFVARATGGGADFVPIDERIATFDNDGTLWVEKPLPNELYFALDRVKAMVAANPALREQQPYKAALDGDAAYFHEAGVTAVLEIFVQTHAGMTQEQFTEEAQRFMRAGRHPKLNRPYSTVVYQPMLELLSYLRAFQFKIWICSGGDMSFMRAFASDVYGVQPEQVIGSDFERESRIEDGRLVIWRKPHLTTINDKDAKPFGIDRQIGRRPPLAAGNVLSGGDVAMLQYSKGRRGLSLQLLVNHDDGEREFAYAEKDGASLDAAKKHGFVVVSMKNDWNTVLRGDRKQHAHTRKESNR